MTKEEKIKEAIGLLNEALKELQPGDSLNIQIEEHGIEGKKELRGRIDLYSANRFGKILLTTKQITEI